VEVFDCVKIRMDIVCISGGARTMEHRTIWERSMPNWVRSRSWKA
jgi:hypothetical protein